MFCLPESSIFDKGSLSLFIYLYKHFVVSVVGLENFHQFLYKIHKKIGLKYVYTSVHVRFIWCMSILYILPFGLVKSSSLIPLLYTFCRLLSGLGLPVKQDKGAVQSVNIITQYVLCNRSRVRLTPLATYRSVEPVCLTDF